MAAPDLIGCAFGKLTVIRREVNDRGGSSRWLCECECGERRVVAGTGLRAGRNRSCGCASPRFTAARVTTHGKSRSRTYSIWAGMRFRCSPAATGDERRLYYARGIRVCARWQAFEAFLEDMGESPDGLTIDRIDGSRGYEPGNCRWATYVEQANNVCSNVRLSLNGKTQTLAEWAREIGINHNTLVYRVRRGWSPERAIGQPAQKRTYA